MDDDLIKSVLMMAMFTLLKDTEGVIVHYEGKGYCVCKLLDEDTNEPYCTVIEDRDYLRYPDRQIVWMHDEPVGNA